MTTSRDKILQRIGGNKTFAWSIPKNITVLKDSVFPDPFPLLQVFVKEIEAVGGEVYAAKGLKGVTKELLNLIKSSNWQKILCEDDYFSNKIVEIGVECNSKINEAEVIITPCEFLVSRSGSVLVSSRSGGGRKVHVAARVHIVTASASQLVSSIGEAFTSLRIKNDSYPSWVALITGASRTADIEKTLVLGAHGPVKIIVLIDVEA